MFPRGLALNDAEDTLYILDGLSNRVRSLSLVTGIIDALPGAQYSDFLPPTGFRTSPYTLTFSGGRLYIGCFNNDILAWSGGQLTRVAGSRTSLSEPADATLGLSNTFASIIRDLAPAPGGGDPRARR